MMRSLPRPTPTSRSSVEIFERLSEIGLDRTGGFAIQSDERRDPAERTPERMEADAQTAGIAATRR